MKLSIHTDRLCSRFGAVCAIKMIAAAGFEAADYSMYYDDNAVFSRGGRVLASELSRVASSYGLVFNQAHAPFTDFHIGEDLHNRKIYESIRESIVMASHLGAPVIVVHPAQICPRISADARFEMNAELFARLSAHGRDYGVGIAIENIWVRHPHDSDRLVGGLCSDAAELIRYADAFREFGVTVCFDSGHAGIVGESAAGMVMALGDRIKHIHLHDNDFETDRHTLPYLEKTNFSSLAKALGKVGYSGDVTLESDGFFKNMPDALVEPALLFSRSVASHIRDEIEKYRRDY